MGYKKNYNSLLPDDFVLSEEFESIVEQLENTKDHFYITGKAGSGKSTLLAYFRSVTQKNTAVLAPTGVAARSLQSARACQIPASSRNWRYEARHQGFQTAHPMVPKPKKQQWPRSAERRQQSE